MNWLDEGALYSQIAVFLREDLGRGDLTTQSILTRNTRARGRFVAGEPMIVAGLEAAEEVFAMLDSQLQLEAFAADGEAVEAGKVIARTSGFADVLLAGERVALNLIERLSAVATLTNKFVQAIEGTAAQISDTRKTTPGLRMLEKYAVMIGGGRNHRFGLDDGIVIKSNHIVVAGGIEPAVKAAKKNLGHLHKVCVQVSNDGELGTAVKTGADVLLFDNLLPDEVARLVKVARELAPGIAIETAGNITLENVRAYAEAGPDLIRVGELTKTGAFVNVHFQIQPY